MVFDWWNKAIFAFRYALLFPDDFRAHRTLEGENTRGEDYLPVELVRVIVKILEEDRVQVKYACVPEVDLDFVSVA